MSQAANPNTTLRSLIAEIALWIPELVEELEKLPEDTPVYCRSGGYPDAPIKVELVKDEFGRWVIEVDRHIYYRLPDPRSRARRTT